MTKIYEINNELYFSYRKERPPPGRFFKDMDKEELLDLFWNANCLSFEDKQKLVTYLNARGHNLKLFRGEMRGELHYTTEYFDGESWKEFKRDYEA